MIPANAKSEGEARPIPLLIPITKVAASEGDEAAIPHHEGAPEASLPVKVPNRQEKKCLPPNCKKMTHVTLLEEQLDDFKEAFKIMDRDNDGFVTIKELPILMRALGKMPTDAELHEITKELENQNLLNNIDFVRFLDIMKRKLKEEGREDDIREAFKVFDKDGTNIINVKEWKHVMTHLGEKLSNEEMDDILAEMEVTEDGTMNYEDFIRLMFHF